jgi:hypothetical protein
MGICATHTHSARVVVPSHANIVHPPDLGLPFNGKLHSNNAKIIKGRIKVDWSQRTVNELWASINGHILRCDNNVSISVGIMTESCECEKARWASRIAADGATIEVEAEATRAIVITISNIPRETSLCRIRTRRCGAVADGEVGNELSKLRW